MVRRVLLFGHSFVHRLESFTFKYRESGWFNLGLDGTDVHIEFFGLGDGTLRPGPKCVQKQECMSIIESNKPTTVFLQVGGNDLSYENNPDKLARDIISFADYVITCYDVHHMIIDQLLPRYSEKPEMNYNNKVVDVNKHLAVSSADCNDITYWRHRGLSKDTQMLLLQDNVHLNTESMHIYANIYGFLRSKYNIVISEYMVF